MCHYPNRLFFIHDFFIDATGGGVTPFLLIIFCKIPVYTVNFLK